MRRAIRRAFLLLVLAAALGAGALYWLQRAFEAPGPLAAPATVALPRGEGLEEIALRLAAAGVIRNPRVFVLGVRLAGAGRALKAGEYAFPAGASARRVMEILLSGRTVARRLTVPEGLTSRQIVALVEAADGLTGTVDRIPAEGSLLPETYHYSFGDSRAGLIARMERAMDRLLASLADKLPPDSPLPDMRAVVTLASIVEKETARADERPRIAGVFLNRLRRGLRLQSDPTVVYALTRGAGPLDRPLSRADLAVDSPYNTYRVRGLPPGPIANPGRAAILAVLAPAETDALYFVADGKGGHLFARTLAEHNRNVRRWRKLQKERKEKEEKEEAPAAAQSE